MLVACEDGGDDELSFTTFFNDLLVAESLSDRKEAMKVCMHLIFALFSVALTVFTFRRLFCKGCRRQRQRATAQIENTCVLICLQSSDSRARARSRMFETRCWAFSKSCPPGTTHTEVSVFVQNKTQNSVFFCFLFVFCCIFRLRVEAASLPLAFCDCKQNTRF